MEIIVIFLIGLFGLIIYLVVQRLGRMKVTNTDRSFSQAGVTVDYEAKTVTVKGKVLQPRDIKGIEWRAGMGPHGNISHALILVRDITTPRHTIEFMTPNGAQDFITRLEIALERVGAEFD